MASVLADDPDLSGDTTTAAKRGGRGTWRQRVLLFGMPALIATVIFTWWFIGQGKVSTDNAYLKQDTVAVTAEVAGKIDQVMIEDGRDVQAGQILFRLDPEPYELALQENRAALAAAQARVTALSHSADLSGSDIAAAREDIRFAQLRFDRQKALWERGFTTKAEFDAAHHAVEQAREELRSAEARQQEARAQLAKGAAVPGVDPQIAAAEANLAEAKLALRRTEVRAPIAGQITKAERVQPGQQVIVGVPMLQIVSQDRAYVEANFKETDLDEIRIGDSVEIKLDAYPDLKLRGHVESIGAGTGSEFSVLPAQNASGNWVKVTQRVPVRIAIETKTPRKLIAGLSAEVTVHTGR